MAHGLVRRESVETEMHTSEEKRKAFVYTKKRGYDVTRNPNLNKSAQVTQNTGSLKFTGWSNGRKKGFLCTQVNRPLSALCMNRGEEIGGEEMKWGASCRKGSLWRGRECWPRSTDVLCLSA
ncbi:hypothetical protein PAMP_002213 [Pampus punctatissimus]